MKVNIADIRKEYKQRTLLETDVVANPMEQFHIWFQQATNSDILEVNAMTLATCSSTGIPSARTVLIKGINEQGFVFYTNYDSQKGMELTENPKAALLFFWKELERQIRITGIVKKISKKDSDAYFKSRPLSSQIGAIISPQSHVIENRLWLENKEKEMTVKATEENIKRPKNWGGYIVQPVNFEFWQGRPSRLHDRIAYHLQQDATWKIERLAP
jgi:pyridoxamine 5'-phosphate oxidase